MPANDPFQQDRQKEFQARITALLLGEYNGSVAAELCEAIDVDPVLIKLRDRLEKTIGLLGETTQPAESLPLDEDRRAALLAQFKTPVPETTADEAVPEQQDLKPEPGRPTPIRQFLKWARPIGLAASLIGLLTVAAVSFLTFTGPERATVQVRSGLRFAEEIDRESVEVEKGWAEALPMKSETLDTDSFKGFEFDSFSVNEDTESGTINVKSIGNRDITTQPNPHYLTGSVKPAGAETDGHFGRFKSDLAAPGAFTGATRSADWDFERSHQLAANSPKPEPTPPTIGIELRGMQSLHERLEWEAKPETGSAAKLVNDLDLVLDNQEIAPGLITFQTNDFFVSGNGATASITVIRTNGSVGPVVVEYETDSESRIPARGDLPLAGRLFKSRAQKSPANSEKNPPAPPAKPEPTPRAKPNPEVQAKDNPFSNFSLNVSDVSFKLAAASLEKGALPDPATIRSEEFVNAFDYRDPAPTGDAKLAFAFEQARDPFAHNRNLMRFAVQTAAFGREPGRPLNLVVLLDNSGSMERPDRVAIVREALRVLSGQLTEADRVSVVAFARTPRLCVDGLPGNQSEVLLSRVLDLNPQGGTNLEAALNAAYATAQKHFRENGNNRVILFTDGAANLGDIKPEALKQKVESFRAKGVALDCFGIGWDGYNDDLMETLSRNGDGRYGFLNDPAKVAVEFADQLAGSLRVAASNVKAQIEFNPARVVSWRQIGYEKHQLKKEQFRDNKVDAAEIGAAESGTALYSIQADPKGSGPIGVARIRFMNPATGRYEEQSWPLAYNRNSPTLDQAAPSIRLAACAAAFAEWLARSPYAAEVTPDALLGYLNEAVKNYALDARPRQLQSMIQHARLTGGQ
ncbi:MAG: YfbK domain-containing protein [Verrucomicrobiia bacterium]